MTRSASAEDPRSRCVANPASFSARARATKLRVLLVDDELEQLLPLADALRQAGVITAIATSTDEALFVIETSPPDVVVLDADLTAPRLRAAVAKLPLVLMIGVPSDAIAGVACITKPLDGCRLLHLLSRPHDL